LVVTGAADADVLVMPTRPAVASAAAVPPTAMREAVEAIETEEARLVAARRGLSLVGDALRGIRFVPRL
jgi:hypothetical protein